MNNLLCKYYDQVGYNLGDKFLNFMEHNQNDDAKEWHFQEDIEPKQCVLTEFDDTFPIVDSRFAVNNKEDRKRFIFYLMQHCFIHHELPSPDYMLRKYLLDSNCIKKEAKPMIKINDNENLENEEEKQEIISAKKLTPIGAVNTIADYCSDKDESVNNSVRHGEEKRHCSQKSETEPSTSPTSTVGNLKLIADVNTATPSSNIAISAINTTQSLSLTQPRLISSSSEHAFELNTPKGTININFSNIEYVQNEEEQTAVKYDDEKIDNSHTNKGVDIQHQSANRCLNFGSPQISSSVLGSSVCSDDGGSIYYKPQENDLISSTFSLCNILSSDEMSNSDYNTMISTENKTNEELTTNFDNNIIQNPLNLVANILNIISSWEIFQEQFPKRRNSNDIIKLPDELNGDKNSEYKDDSGDDDDHGDNGDHGDDGDDGDEYGEHHDDNDDDNDDDNNDDDDDDGDYPCNVPWHDDKIKELNSMVYTQQEEIRKLKINLQYEIELNSLIRIDRAIGDYYRKMDVIDYYVQGNGLFWQYVTKENLNNGKFPLSQQLGDNADPQHCVYTHFDAEFPFPNFIDINAMNHSEKQRIIFGIIQYCYQNNMAPSEQYIREKLYHIPQQQQSKLTAIDGLYQWIKHSDKLCDSRMTLLEQFLVEEEYDSDALSIDIVTDNNNKSNIVQLLNMKGESAFILQNMFQNAAEYTSYPDLIINTSRKLTEKIVKKIVAEKFCNEAFYMEKYILMHGNHAMIKFNGDNILVIDYNFHSKKKCKETESKSLYVVCDRKKQKNKKDFEWKMRDNLFEWHQIQKMLKMSQTAKPRSMKPILMYAFEQHRQKILCLLQNKKERSKLIERKSTPWTDREKIQIIGKRAKIGKKSKSLYLHLSKEEWVKRLSKFANNNVNCFNLLPIVTFDGNTYCIETVWIVQIEININIGILLKLHRDYSKCESLMALRIYLDINDEHKLVPYQHDCQCLNDFVCNIDDLRIGDSEQNQWKMKNRELQRKLNKANERINTSKNQTNEKQIIIDNEIYENEEEKQEVISAEELTPNDLSDDFKENTISITNQQQNIGSNISATTPIINQSINNDNINNYNINNYNDEQNCQCLAAQKNITLQKSLNEANQYTKSLEALRENDVTTIVQMKSVSIMLENDLKKTQKFVQSLLRKQTELQQQQNSQQQIINSLEVKYVAYIKKLEDINNFYFQQTLNFPLSIIIPHQQHRIRMFV